MTKSKISVPEAIGILLSIFIAHTIVSLPRNLLLNTRTSTIINLIYIGILSIFIVLFIVKLLRKFPNSDIVDISEYLGGQVFKKIMGFIFIAYFVFSFSVLVKNFCECLKVVSFPITNLVFIIATFIIVILIVVNYEFKIIAKVNLFILPIIIISMFFIFFANLSNFSFQNIYPVFGQGVFNTFVTGLINLSAFGGIYLLYFLPPYLSEPEKLKKISIITVSIATIYLILCVATILFMFTFLAQVDEIMPLYSAARRIEFGTFFQRLESAFLLIWIIEIAAYSSICLKLSMNIFNKITNIKNIKPLILPFGLVIFSITILPHNYAISKFLENSVYPYLVLGVTFILNISILILANFKKKKVNLENENK